MKSWHGPQETPNQNFEKNSLMFCQTRPVLSDAVWAETVSPKLVEEIAFDLASETENFGLTTKHYDNAKKHYENR
jgi:hypothetical protein